MCRFLGKALSPSAAHGGLFPARWLAWLPRTTGTEQLNCAVGTDRLGKELGSNSPINPVLVSALEQQVTPSSSFWDFSTGSWRF